MYLYITLLLVACFFKRLSYKKKKKNMHTQHIHTYIYMCSQADRQYTQAVSTPHLPDSCILMTDFALRFMNPFRHSLSSNAPSETDTVDLNSSQASPAFSQLSILMLNLQADEIEEAWRVHVSKVMVESSLTHIGKTSQIFPRLFRVRYF